MLDSPVTELGEPVNRMPRLATVVVVSLLAAGTAACETSSSRSTCRNETCTVTVSGSSRQVVNLFLDRELVVEDIADGSVSVTVRGRALRAERRTVHQGVPTAVADVTVTLESASRSPRRAKLVVTGRP